MYLNFCDIKSKSKDELIDFITKSNPKPLKDISLYEITYLPLGDIFTGNGIYIFLNQKNEIVYIGKASSRPFLERLGGHLDLRAEGTFNNLLREIACKEHNIKKKDLLSNHLIEASSTLFSLRLLIIPINDHPWREKIKSIESIMIRLLDPRPIYNKRAGITPPFDKSIESTLSLCA